MIVLMISWRRLMGTWLTVERKKLSEDSNALKISVLRITDDSSVDDELAEVDGDLVDSEEKKLSDDSNALMISVLRVTDDSSVDDESI